MIWLKENNYYTSHNIFNYYYLLHVLLSAPAVPLSHTVVLETWYSKNLGFVLLYPLGQMSILFIINSWFARPGKYWRKPKEMQNSTMQHVTSKKGQVRCITYTEGAMELHIFQCCHQRLVNDSIAFGRTYLIDSHLSTRYNSTSQLLHNWGQAIKMLPRGGRGEQ